MKPTTFASFSSRTMGFGMCVWVASSCAPFKGSTCEILVPTEQTPEEEVWSVLKKNRTPEEEVWSVLS
jgi:hypothetical protein